MEGVNDRVALKRMILHKILHQNRAARTQTEDSLKLMHCRVSADRHQCLG